MTVTQLLPIRPARKMRHALDSAILRSAVNPPKRGPQNDGRGGGPQNDRGVENTVLLGRNPLGQVLTAVRSGIPTNRLAATLGIDAGLAEMALQHWIQLGVITPAGELSLVCNGCAPTTVAGADNPKSAKCVGCPFAR